MESDDAQVSMTVDWLTEEATITLPPNHGLFTPATLLVLVDRIVAHRQAAEARGLAVRYCNG